MKKDTSARNGAPAPRHASVTPEMDRRNGRIFFACYTLYYLASPVLYVGIVHTALCDRLGAGALVANGPVSAFGLGSILPALLFPVIPYRWERSVVVISNWLLTAGLLGAAASLLLPCPNSVRIVMVVAQALITGLALSMANVFTFQCLGRGTSVEGRARTLKLTFSVGPICAVAAAFGTQYVLSRGFGPQQYRLAFGLIFLWGVPCTLGAALLSWRYDLIWICEERRSQFLKFFVQAVKSFGADRKFVLLWLCYFLWACSSFTEPNTSLHIRQVLRVPPQQFSGIILALRFGCKALAGLGIGALAVTRGIRSPLAACVTLTGMAILWAGSVGGHSYLAAFGMLGAGELANAYFPNYTISISAPENGAANLSLMRIADALAGFSPLVYGALAEAAGFRFSILAGIAPFLVSLWLVSKLSSRPRQACAAPPAATAIRN